MLSSNQNIDTISRLILAVKQHYELRKEAFELDFVSKLTSLLAALVVGTVLFILIVGILLFLSVMTATALASYVGGTTMAYAIIVVFYIFLALLIYFKRKKWIEAPIANFLGHLFLDANAAKGSMNATDEVDLADNTRRKL